MSGTEHSQKVLAVNSDEWYLDDCSARKVLAVNSDEWYLDDCSSRKVLAVKLDEWYRPPPSHNPRDTHTSRD